MKDTRREGGASKTQSTPTTDHLMNKLMSEKDFKAFLAQYEPSLIDKDVSKELDRLLRKYLVMKNEAVKASGIERSYGYHIIAGKKMASRDKLLRLAIGIGCDLEETQRLLRIAEEGALYPRVKRDAAIIRCILDGKDVMETNLFLEDADCMPLL